MPPPSRDDARELIAEIGIDNGYVSPEDRANTPRNVLRSLTSTLKKLGSSTRTLATQLYSKDTRFIFELIQNAEDNDYSWAIDAGEDPFLRFSLYPDKLLVECNEDGFKEENVRAICSIGESSKSHRGYIGEKGIGFKSVFKVAKKVHVQSEPFSFAFEHDRQSDADGLGMVTPINHDHVDLPEDVQTRFTLNLLDSTTEKSSFEKRREDLQNLPDTLLLFLSQLVELQVTIYPDAEEPTKTIYRVFSRGQDLETITKTVEQGGETMTTIHDYHVVRRQIENLPGDDARPNTRQATVVLAFPVDEDEAPVLESQHAYAYLPLREVGYTFLVQSDFIAQANREDVVDSPWNRALLRGVAEAFRDAVLRFCKHDLLQFQWMSYLPSDTISNEFWRDLRPQLMDLLRNTEILRSRRDRQLCRPAELCIITNDFKDQRNNPLLEDLPHEIYLSAQYRPEDYHVLRTLGTYNIKSGQVLDRLEADLNHPNSRYKSQTTDADWHSRFSKLFLRAYQGVRTTITEHLERMRLIPVQGADSWISARTLPIYFPEINGTPIPKDLQLRLVQIDSIKNPDRRNLFAYMGVTTATVTDIMAIIYSRYTDTQPLSVLCEHSITHLAFIFLQTGQEITTLDPRIWLFSGLFWRVFPNGNSKRHIYFRDKDETYSPWELLSSSEDAHSMSPVAHFLYSNYISAVPPSVIRRGRTYRKWLEEVVGVREIPQLLDEAGKNLSREFQFIIQSQPEKLPGLLKKYWKTYDPQLHVVEKALRQSLISCQMPRSQPINKTYLPLPALRTVVEEMGIEEFPFLHVCENLTDSTRHHWACLTRLGIGLDKDLSFYQDILRCFTGEFDYPGEVEGLATKLFEVYRKLSEHCITAENSACMKKNFEEENWIYFRDGNDELWLTSIECVWDGPEWLQSAYRLPSMPEYNGLDHFFRNIVKIRNANYHDYLDDLRLMKEKDNKDLTTAVQIYRRLRQEFQNDQNYQSLREIFEEENLVLLPTNDSWHKLSACIWADSRITIPQRASLKTVYAGLEDFFHVMLGVPEPDVSMHVDGLREYVQGEKEPSRVKKMMKLISSMNPPKSETAKLAGCNMFQVRFCDGSLVWTNSHADFAIIDRKEYGEAFRDLIKTLDFTIEEVRACQPLLEALNLGSKFLSESVTEVTTVTDGSEKGSLTRQLRERAYALCRCAVHYNSPQIRNGDLSLLTTLQNVKVYTSTGISKTMNVLQYGRNYSVESSRANFHLDYSGNELRLYVPHRRNDREKCLISQLPKGLAGYLGISNGRAELTISNIIKSSSLSIVNGILTEAGIVEVGGVETPNFENEDESASDGENVLAIPEIRSASSSASSRRAEVASAQALPNTPPSTYAGSTVATPTSVTDNGQNDLTRSLSPSPLQSTNQSPSPSPSILRSTQLSYHPPAIHFTPSAPTSETSSDANAIYTALLDHVVRAASDAAFPECGSELLLHGRPFTHEVPRRSYIDVVPRTFERDKKIGAAGELLVFEILKRMALPGFSRDNWQSTIRSYVSSCAGYSDMEPWTGRETSDIVYNDDHGSLTKWLIQKGYLTFGQWINAHPKYYIEVKTTTRESREKFFMSGSQYDRMSSLALQPNVSSPEVYIILRVFNLEKRDIGVKLYVDPMSAKESGELDFSVDTWGVKRVTL